MTTGPTHFKSGDKLLLDGGKIEAEYGFEGVVGGRRLIVCQSSGGIIYVRDASSFTANSKASKLAPSEKVQQ